MAKHRWVGKYDLIYEGGVQVRFTRQYRTRTGARLSAWYHTQYRSWGGTAQLHPTP